MNTPPAIGDRIGIAGQSITVTATEAGTEYGDPVWNITGTTSLGGTITRWAPMTGDAYRRHQREARCS